MADSAYLSVWFREFTVERGLRHLEAALALFPQSAARTGFHLVVRSLGPEEGSTLERDLIAAPADVHALASEFLHEDTAYEVTAFWELWQPHPGGRWEQAPSPVELVLQGAEYNPTGGEAERAHLLINLGRESLFIGRAATPQESSRGPLRGNVDRLYSFLGDLHNSLPVERHLIWSEGNEDFARLAEQLQALR
ncbi:MAG: hypothetical protein L0212_05650 [Acidobacteria bacterium]|nr:hypothetical protein [Acidobacteriota bacterium]